MQERLRFWAHNQQAAHLAVLKIGIEGNAIVVADLRDPIALEITENFGKCDHSCPGQIPTAIIVVPTNILSMLLKDVNPVISEKLLTSPVPGTVWAVVISSGGSSLIQTLPSKMTKGGQA